MIAELQAWAIMRFVCWLRGHRVVEQTGPVQFYGGLTTSRTYHYCERCGLLCDKSGKPKEFEQ